MIAPQPQLNSMIAIAHAIGGDPSITQGGGGNVSVKTTGAMAVKASGLRLDELDDKTGFAHLAHEDIRRFFKGDINSLDDAAIESLSGSCVKGAFIGPDGSRPSIEAGFHALLESSVIHTHAVLANLLNCSEEGGELSRKLFSGRAYVAYETPGAPLTRNIAHTLRERPASLFFLENHGIITSGDSPEAADRLHRDALERISSHFHLAPTYPRVSIRALKDVYISDTPFLKEFLTSHPDILEQMRTNPLFPDQMVYTEHPGINVSSNRVTYNTSPAFARAAEETFVAWVWLIENMRALGLTAKYIPKDKAAVILLLESEKYRKQLIS